jgi:hypothetical protein
MWWPVKVNAVWHGIEQVQLKRRCFEQDFLTIFHWEKTWSIVWKCRSVNIFISAVYRAFLSKSSNVRHCPVSQNCRNAMIYAGPHVGAVSPHAKNGTWQHKAWRRTRFVKRRSFLRDIILEQQSRWLAARSYWLHCLSQVFLTTRCICYVWIVLYLKQKYITGSTESYVVEITTATGYCQLTVCVWIHDLSVWIHSHIIWYLRLFGSSVGWVATNTFTTDNSITDPK